MWQNVPSGNYTLTAKAIDNQGGATISSPINVNVEEVISCTQTFTQAQQGQFSTGYTATFETVGNTVNITFELLDTDKSGVVAWLWQESPFQEFDLTQDGARTFRRSISSLETGQTLSFACKFAYAGGLSVTNYIQYVVGSNCSGTVPEENNNQEEEEEEEEENEQETPPVENTLCSGQSTEATQESFSSDSPMSLFLLQPTYRSLCVIGQSERCKCHLWQENPFRESGMNSIGNNRFEATIDLAQGESTEFACKFAFAGGLAVTKYFTTPWGKAVDKVLLKTMPTKMEFGMILINVLIQLLE